MLENQSVFRIRENYEKQGIGRAYKQLGLVQESLHQEDEIS